jgi:hypothetical protein
MAEARNKKLFVFSDADNCIYSEQYRACLLVLENKFGAETNSIIESLNRMVVSADVIEELFARMLDVINTINVAELSEMTDAEFEMTRQFSVSLDQLGLRQRLSTIIVQKVNEKLFVHIAELMAEHDFSAAAWGTSSARSDRTYELGNADSNGTGIKVAELEHLVQTMQTYTPVVPWQMHTVMLADIYENQPIGTARASILEEMRECDEVRKNLRESQRADTQSMNQALQEVRKKWHAKSLRSLYDGSKLSLYYALAHLVARENPNVDCTLLILDDSAQIFRTLSLWLERNAQSKIAHTHVSHFFPAGVKLFFREYNGCIGPLHFAIKGSGRVDETLAETLPMMASQCSFNKNPQKNRYTSKYFRHFDPTIQLNVSRFIRKRDECLEQSSLLSKYTLFACDSLTTEQASESLPLAHPAPK